MTQLLESPGTITFVRALAITLPVLLGYAIAFGLISIVNAFLHGFFNFTESVVGGAIGWIPGAGKWVKGKIEAAEHKATDRLGEAAHNLEGHVADAFHALSNQVHSVGHEIYGLSIALWQVTHFLHSWGHPATRDAKLTDFGRAQVAADARAQALAKRQAADRRAIDHSGTGPIAAGTHTIIKPLDARLAQQWAQIHALEGGYALPHALPRAGVDTPARERAKTAERGAETVWDRLGDLSWRTAGVGAVALVTVAMGRLGLGWFRCSNVTRVAKRLCRMNPSTLEDLLGLTLAVVGTISIIEFAKELQGVVGEVADDVHRLIRDK